MSNSWKTLADGKITRRCLESFRNKLTFIPTIDHQYDNTFDKNGQKSGGNLLIRLPNQFTTSTGAAMDKQDVTERTTTMTVATQMHVDFGWTSVEECLTLDEAANRVFDPAMATLAQMVEYTILSNVYKDVYNFTGTAATDPASIAAISNARARLTQMLVPSDSNVNLMLDPVAMSKCSQAVYTYFHKNSEIEKAFIENYIGTAAGCNWFESTMVPTHTNGSRTDATPIVNTSTGITSGTAEIVTTGQTNAQTIAVGDVFTIQDVYAVNPITKQRLPFLQQWTCTEAITCDTTDTIKVSPTPYTSGALQNVELVSAGASKAIVHVAAGGSGAASTGYTQNLMYHKSAFAVAFAKLTTPSSGQSNQVAFDNISMRIWKDSDIKSDMHDCRIDVLFGYKTVRPQFAVRVRG